VHPSPFTIFPSSHSYPTSRIAFPQTFEQLILEFDEQLVNNLILFLSF